MVDLAEVIGVPIETCRYWARSHYQTFITFKEDIFPRASNAPVWVLHSVALRTARSRVDDFSDFDPTKVRMVRPDRDTSGRIGR